MGSGAPAIGQTSSPWVGVGGRGLCNSVPGKALLRLQTRTQVPGASVSSPAGGDPRLGGSPGSSLVPSSALLRDGASARGHSAERECPLRLPAGSAVPSPSISAQHPGICPQLGRPTQGPPPGSAPSWTLTWGLAPCVPHGAAPSAVGISSRVICDFTFLLLRNIEAELPGSPSHLTDLWQVSFLCPAHPTPPPPLSHVPRSCRGRTGRTDRHTHVNTQSREM